jgi:hypothetical protein
MYAAPPITAFVQFTHLAYIWDMLGFSLIPITFLLLLCFFSSPFMDIPRLRWLLTDLSFGLIPCKIYGKQRNPVRDFLGSSSVILCCCYSHFVCPWTMLYNLRNDSILKNSTSVCLHHSSRQIKWTSHCYLHVFSILLFVSYCMALCYLFWVKMCC